MIKDGIKDAIKKSYGDIAIGHTAGGCCSASSGCCTTDTFGATMNEDYANVDGYNKAADLALGCGIPTDIANIKSGDTVVDLGSGAGNDVFVARDIVGETGRVIGVDMTPEMVILALQNNQKLGFENVEFELNEIENMTKIGDSVADVVVSNCVLNLVPNKEKAFSEIFRILKKDGHFSISDIVLVGSLPKKLLEATELFVGCVAGAEEKGKYLGVVKSAGFKNIQIKKERKLDLPDELLLKYLNELELADYKSKGNGVYSITIYADKLEEGAGECCESTDSNCCGSEVGEKKEKAEGSCCSSSSESSTCC